VGLAASGWAVHTSVCLTSLTPFTCNSWQ
jgi:hypothetical protein